MNELEMLQIKLGAQKALCRNTLLERLMALRSTLSIEIEKLQDDNYSPSANGIIQSEASVIDTLAAKLNTLNNII